MAEKQTKERKSARTSYFGYVAKGFRLKHYFNYILVLAALLIFIILQATGTMKRSTVGLLTQIGYSVILAVSLNIVVGFLGELSLGHAGFMCVGAYLGTFIGSALSTFIPNKVVVLILSMLIGGLIAALFGLVVGLPALRLKGDYLAIVTLAFGEIVRTVFKNLPWFGGSLGLATKVYSTDRNFGNHLFIIAFIVVLIMLFLVQNLLSSKHGRAITAIRDNEIAARAMGINVTYYKLFVFVFAAFFAGVAGVIYGAFTEPILYSAFDYNYSIEILVMVVLGGMGSITGSILAATLITTVNLLLQTNLSGDLAALKFLVYALILMVVVIFNNAPALRPIKERLSFNKLLAGIHERRRRRNPEKYAANIRSDDAAWDRIPTKIRMDEVLSTDVVNPEGSVMDHGDKNTDSKGGAR